MIMLINLSIAQFLQYWCIIQFIRALSCCLVFKRCMFVQIDSGGFQKWFFSFHMSCFGSQGAFRSACVCFRLNNQFSCLYCAGFTPCSMALGQQEGVNSVRGRGCQGTVMIVQATHTKEVRKTYRTKKVAHQNGIEHREKLSKAAWGGKT